MTVVARVIACVLGASILGSAPAAWAADTASAVAEADLEAKQIANAAAKQKLQTDALATIKPTLGAVDPTATAGTAEALVLTELALRQAAAIVSGEIEAKVKDKGDLLVVFGGDKPTFSNWLRYDGAKKRVAADLEAALGLWDSANTKLPVHPSIGPKALDGEDTKDPKFVMPETTAATVAIGTVTTLMTAFRTDYALSGSAFSTDPGQMASILTQALRTREIAVQTPQYVLTNANTEDMATLDAQGRSALKALNAYQRRVAENGGKTTGLPDPVVAAGQYLTSSYGDYQAFVKALYTPNEKSVLWIEKVIEEKRLSAAIGTAPVLYVRNYKAATSLYTKKNLFSGYIGIPAFIGATANIDYDLFVGNKIESGNATYSTDFVRVTDARKYGHTSKVTKVGNDPVTNLETSRISVVTHPALASKPGDTPK